MHMIKPDGPHRPGRSVFSWHDSEAKVNSQFPRITKAASYPSTGPPSRPISQESLHRWEKAAWENSYIINHAAGFNLCSSELQDKMSQNISLLCCRINKGKAPKEVSGALNDLRDLMAFHQRVSVAMGTSLQHLADNLFVNLSNLILLRRDAYLDFVKSGVKQDPMNLLRNAPLFGYGLFPDAAIVSAEQDIQKHETSSVAQRPGPGVPQHTNWRGSHRFRPYERRDKKTSSSADHSSQQQQPWTQFSRSRSRGRGPSFFPSLTSISPINDNHCVGPTPIQVDSVQLDPERAMVFPRVQDVDRLNVKTKCSKTINSSLAVGCALSCCSSCSFCLLTLASAKERIKSRSYSEQNKACQRCMLCKSMSFCPSCSQCPQCCHRTECRGKVTIVLASLARNGCKSSSDFCLERGLHPSIQTETPVDKVSPSSEWLCQPSKEPVLKGSLTQSHEQVGSRKGDYQVISGFLQPAFPCPQTKQKMETNLGPESVELIPQYQYLQDGNSGDNLVILTNRGMGDIAGLQRRVFPHSNKSKVAKISEVLPVQSNLPIHSSSFWSGHSSSRVYQGGQGSETYGSSKGYQVVVSSSGYKRSGIERVVLKLPWSII